MDLATIKVGENEDKFIKFASGPGEDRIVIFSTDQLISAARRGPATPNHFPR